MNVVYEPKGRAREYLELACNPYSGARMGKLNHMKEYERTVDWDKFLFDAETPFAKLGEKYYIKNDPRSFSIKQ